VRQSAHALQGARRPFAGAHGEGKQLGDSGELGEHALLALVGDMGEPLVPRNDPGASEAQHQEDNGQGRRVARHDGKRPQHEAADAADRAPDHLFGPEPLDVGWLAGSLKAPPNRGAAAKHPLDASSQVGDDRPKEARDTPPGATRGDASGQQP